MADPARLQNVLDRLRPLVVDDAGAADMAQAQGQRIDERVRRLGVLRRERVPLKAAVEGAIASGGATLRPTRALQTVRAWLEREDVAPVLVLSGGTGCGKTVAAAYALAEQRAGVWRTAPQLCRTFSASFGDQVDDQELCLTASMLVVDDVGAELAQQRERMAATLVELLEHRKRSARFMRTVVTTNLNRSAFDGQYGSERLRSRMAETGIVAWVETRDPDLRRSGT